MASHINQFHTNPNDIHNANGRGARVLYRGSIFGVSTENPLPSFLGGFLEWLGITTQNENF